MRRIRTKNNWNIQAKMQRDFDTFWDCYPRKVAKQAAFLVWNRIYSRLPAMKLLIQIIQRQIEHYEWDKADKRQYIPHPRTWLNQGRWEDDIGFTPESKTGINIGSQRERF
jgi:hypothetical protein